MRLRSSLFVLHMFRFRKYAARVFIPRMKQNKSTKYLFDKHRPDSPLLLNLRPNSMIAVHSKLILFVIIHSKLFNAFWCSVYNDQAHTHQRIT